MNKLKQLNVTKLGTNARQGALILPYQTVLGTQLKKTPLVFGIFFRNMNEKCKYLIYYLSEKDLIAFEVMAKKRVFKHVPPTNICKGYEA